jgi:hypothetical protein
MFEYRNVVDVVPISPRIKDSLAVLVVSCDKYSDLWRPFFDSFRRFWPDCPFNVYLLSNTTSYDVVGVRNILSGNDVSWSDSLRKGVSQLKEDYVLLFLDDLLLHRPVNTKRVSEILSWAIESNVNYLRMNPMNNKPDKSFNEFVGILSKGVIYRTSTVLSVWKKEALLDLLKPGESAWDFEVHGSVRSDKYDKFYASWKDCFAVTNAVIKGKWCREAVKKSKSLGIKIDLNSRDIMTLGETIVYGFKKLRSRILSSLPAKYRRKIKSFVQRRI